MIQLSPTASETIRHRLQETKGGPLALRIGVKGGGCSGMTYVLDLDSATPKSDDLVFTQDGITILIDGKSHQYLDGVTIEYRNSLMGGGFEFINPQAKKSCGCGTSFSV